MSPLIAAIEEIREKDYNLTPASYVGVAHSQDNEEPFEEKMGRLTAELGELFK